MYCGYNWASLKEEDFRSQFNFSQFLYMHFFPNDNILLKNNTLGFSLWRSHAHLIFFARNVFMILLLVFNNWCYQRDL